jgi:hypothetical protein
MTRRPTFSELAWPEGPDDRALAVKWAKASSFRILDWTWRAFDALSASHLSKIDLTQPLEQIERDLVRQHFVEIQILFARETNGYSALVPHHEWPEMETRTSASAKPPAYDLAFVSTVDRRWAWPIEAKVIPTPSTLAEYLKDVEDKFIAGVASPLIGEGAMIGYLLCSDGQAFVASLAAKLGQPLKQVADFPNRTHRTSEHTRSARPSLTLHHMVMECVK